MTFKSIFTIVCVEEGPASKTCVNYASKLAAATDAHLSVMIGVPRVAAPSGMIIPQVRGLFEAANAERKKRAEVYCDENISTITGCVMNCEVVYDVYLKVRDQLIARARRSDLVVLGPSGEFASMSYDVMRAVVFTSGRPVVLVPEKSNKPAAWKKILVAWDGSAPAARALGDAMPFIERAETVEIISVLPDAGKSPGGAPLAAHLRRHCKSVNLSDIPLLQGDVGKTLRAHAVKTEADLIVMGAWSHSRLWEMVLGGATQDVLDNIETPTLLSH